MALINPAFTVTVTPQRPTEDFGEETFADIEPLQAVVSLGAAVHDNTGSQSRFRITGTVFVPRGSDLAANDVIPYKGHTLRVVGQARGDQDQPFTGDDFGWVSYAVEAAG